MEKEGVDSGRIRYTLIHFDLDKVKKSRKDLLSMYLYGGRRYYYYKNERREHRFKPLVDERNIIGAGRGAVMTTREGMRKLKERIEKLKIKLKEKGIFRTLQIFFI